jgi:hypothetical protein
VLAETAQQGADGHLGRDRPGRGRQVHQVALDAGPGRPPHGRAQHRRRHPDRRNPGEMRLLLAAHQRPEQPGQQHDVVDLRAGVADPQLDRWHVGRRPHVEVDHRWVEDRP